mmetsp:Transcript_17641/g.55625  ORF Transcript_17641/g.55625 Transcript_17641/m.55625 type:complete len:266 (-) Transcript_17641:835-1632(-)
MEEQLRDLLQPGVSQDLLHRRGPLLRVKRHKLLAEIARQGEVWPWLLVPLQDLLLDGLVHLLGARAAHGAVLQRDKRGPRCLTCHEDVEDHADRPDVRLRGDLAEQGLRRDVAGGAHEAAALGTRRGPLHAGVEVDQLDGLGRLGRLLHVEHDILWLYVAVDQAGLVEVPNGDEDLSDDPLALDLRHLGLVHEELEQLAAIALRHDDVERHIVLQDLCDIEDVAAPAHLVHLGHDGPPCALRPAVRLLHAYLDDDLAVVDFPCCS